MSLPFYVYFKLPLFLQNFILNSVGIIKNLIRKHGIYKQRYQIYLDFYNGKSRKENKLNDLEFILKAFPIKSVNGLDIKNYPIISKNEIKKSIKLFNPLKRWSSIAAKTSGSSGNGLSFWKSINSERDTWAAYDAFREYHGIVVTDWCGYFCGNLITDLNKFEIYKKCLPTKQIIYSQYHLSQQSVSEYINSLNKFKPRWIHGYPSFLLELAQLSVNAGLELTYTPSLITTGSENLQKPQKLLLETFFSCKVRDLYCQSEMVAMLYECKEGVLHINELYSDVEIVDSEDGMSKLIGTNLNNTHFPLVRYDTEDLLLGFDNDFECSCGSSGRPFKAIEGRADDYLILSDGKKLGRLDHILKGLNSVYCAQFIQFIESNEIMLYLIVNTAHFDIHILKKSLTKYLPNEIVNIKIVSNIEREANGKIKFVKRVNLS